METPVAHEARLNYADRFPFFNPVLRLRAYLAQQFCRVSDIADRHPILALLALLLVVIPAILGHSIIQPLWHDELFTYYIAQEPTLSQMFHATRLIDLIPPLSPLLTRASFQVFGVNTLSTRLPEITGFLLAMTSLFMFVRRRAGTLYGLAAATLLYTGPAGYLAYQARPYGLMLGFGTLALLAWQYTTEKRRFAIPLLSFAGFGLLLDHVFGIYIWGAILIAEAIRVILRRRIHWPFVLAWCLPLLSAITWIPALRNHGGGVFPAAFQPTQEVIAAFYTTLVAQATFVVLVSALVLLAVAGRRALSGSSTWLLTVPEWVAMFVLLSVPLVIALQLMRAHAAFFDRYGVPASIAVSVFAPILLAIWMRRDTRAALACIVLALLFTGEMRFALRAIRHRHVLTQTEPVRDPCDACSLSAKIDPSLPLVDASGLAFVEMNAGESRETLSRLYYLTYPTAPAQDAHANIFEGMALEKDILHLHGNVATYTEFVHLHRHFFVFGDYAYPEDWLLPKLMADGAHLTFLGRGKSYGNSHEIYEVTFPQAY